MESSATPSGEENKSADTSKLQKGANLLFDALKKETIKQKNDEVITGQRNKWISIDWLEFRSLKFSIFKKSLGAND